MRETSRDRFLCNPDQPQSATLTISPCSRLPHVIMLRPPLACPIVVIIHLKSALIRGQGLASSKRVIMARSRRLRTKTRLHALASVSSTSSSPACNADKLVNEQTPPLCQIWVSQTRPPSIQFPRLTKSVNVSLKQSPPSTRSL